MRRIAMAALLLAACRSPRGGIGEPCRRDGSCLAELRCQPAGMTWDGDRLFVCAP